jgi:hypothetical protein
MSTRSSVAITDYAPKVPWLMPMTRLRPIAPPSWTFSRPRKDQRRVGLRRARREMVTEPGRGACGVWLGRIGQIPFWGSVDPDANALCFGAYHNERSTACLR